MDSQSEPPNSRTGKDDTTASEQASPAATLQTNESTQRSTIARNRDLGVKHHTIEELTSAGWVAVPNSGKVPSASGGDGDGPRGATDTADAVDLTAARDFRAHAAKNVSFELESPRSRGVQGLEHNGQQSVTGSRSAPQSGLRSASGRVESVPHVVEPNENFWTISRLYYSSGRYYRALWKANADKYPEISKLKVNDVIMIPPVEDLDTEYIDPPRSRSAVSPGATATRSRSSKQADTVDLADSSLPSSESQPVSTARTNHRSADGVPVHRSSRADPGLDLPAPAAVARQDRGLDRSDRRADRRLGDDDTSNEEPETRSAARPRAAGSASLSRPVYKIRPYDTLRSIARDMLGDSHRANEIIELNRDLIDDPNHLIVGQMLELPDDARTSLRRPSRRSSE
jgi:nucleoid-associated protein YgaU